MKIHVISKKDPYQHFTRIGAKLTALDCFNVAGDSRIEMHFADAPRVLVSYYKHDLSEIERLRETLAEEGPIGVETFEIGTFKIILSGE